MRTANLGDSRGGCSLFRRARRFWRLPLVVLFAAALGCAAFLRASPPCYRSATTILYVERSNPLTIDTPARGGPALRLRELLMSRQRLAGLVAELDLYPELRRHHGDAEAVEELRRHTGFRTAGGGAFEIAFESESPDSAQRVTAKLGRLLIDGDAEQRRSHAELTLKFFADEEQKSESEVLRTEQELAAFMAEHPRLAFDTAPPTYDATFRPPAARPVDGTGGAGPVEARWLLLKRAAVVARQRASEVTGQLLTADIFAGSEAAGIRATVIDPAFLPQRPLPPEHWLIIVMFAAGALILGVGGALARAAAGPLLGTADATPAREPEHEVLPHG